MKYTGLVLSIIATGAAIQGVEFAAPLLALFGTMMGIGQIADLLSNRDGTPPADGGNDRNQ